MNRHADIPRRIAEIERTAVRFRVGTVTSVTPLAVDLGGSGVPHQPVKSITDDIDVNDLVAVLVFGNDLLVLGRIR